MRRHSPAGTTLIELLVALSLLSLMAVLLLGGMRLGLRVWDVGGDRQVFEQRRGAYRCLSAPAFGPGGPHCLGGDDGRRR